MPYFRSAFAGTELNEAFFVRDYPVSPNHPPAGGVESAFRRARHSDVDLPLDRQETAWSPHLRPFLDAGTALQKVSKMANYGGGRLEAIYVPR